VTERINPREVHQDPDIQLVGAFGGLSSASYQMSGDILYADKLTNAYVSKRNEIKKRVGSTIATYYGSIPATNNFQLFEFTYDSINYRILKNGLDIYVDYVQPNGLTGTTVYKYGAFSKATNDNITFAVVIQQGVCFVLMASTLDTLRALAILKRPIALSTASGSTLAGTIVQYPVPNSLLTTNTLVYTSANALIPASSVSQSGYSLSITTVSPHGLTTSAQVRAHGFYLLNTCSASYYPGNFLYDNGARLNAVPLNVNVEVPVNLVANPLVNESQTQDTTQATIVAYQTNSATATQYTRVFNRQPTTATQWDFSDGAFLPGNTNLYCNRTPAYISFGALDTANPNGEEVFCFRTRQILLAPGYAINPTSLITYVDKNPVSPAVFDSTYAATTTSASYFSMATNASPGISLSSVVELMYAPGTVVDLSGQTYWLIADNYTVPLYGYGAIGAVGAGKYPNIVLNVGDTVVLTGFDNTVTFSNADWEYRGITWNNFQVSTIDFSATSAYTVVLGQSSSIVLGIQSVNGVLIVSTDVGLFRISGSDVILPPNATTTNVSRISNEIALNQNCLLIYENKIFYVSVHGLYQLQYNLYTSEIQVTPMSTQVSDKFNNAPLALVYSPTMRAFVISFTGSSVLLCYFLESESWCEFKLAFTSVPSIYQSYDGYGVNFINSTNSSLSNFHICFWDTTKTTDLSNTSYICPNSTITARSVSIANVQSSTAALITPACLIDSIDPGSNNLVQAYGRDQALSASGNTVTVSEYAGGAIASPIISYLVTKAFYSDKILRSARVRAINVLATGSGAILSRLVFDGANEANVGQQFDYTLVNSGGASNSVQEKATVTSRVISGDTVLLRLRYSGVGEAWAYACRLDGTVSLLGYQLDSATKAKGRLR